MHRDWVQFTHETGCDAMGWDGMGWEGIGWVVGSFIPHDVMGPLRIAYGVCFKIGQPKPPLTS